MIKLYERVCIILYSLIYDLISELLSHLIKYKSCMTHLFMHFEFQAFGHYYVANIESKINVKRCSDFSDSQVWLGQSPTCTSHMAWSEYEAVNNQDNT